MIVHLYEELGDALRRALERHVRVRALGRARASCSSRATASARSRSTTPSSAVSLLFGSELKALLEHPRCPATLDLDAPLAVPRARVRARRRARSSRASGSCQAGTSSAGATGAPLGRALLGSRVRPATTRRRSTTSTSRSSRLLSRGGPPSPDQRRPARRVPERRDRLELGRRDDGRRSPAGPSRRSRSGSTSELRRVGARPPRRRALRHRPPRGDVFTPRRDARPPADRRRLPRRAVRRRLDPPDLPALALHARARHRRTRRRRRRRAPRRLPDLPADRARSSTACRASSTSASSSRSPTGCPSRRELQLRLQAQAVPPRRGRAGRRAAPDLARLVHPRGASALLTRGPPTRSRSSGKRSARPDETGSSG